MCFRGLADGKTGFSPPIGPRTRGEGLIADIPGVEPREFRPWRN